jgi:histidine triad (HIT) family protein
MLSEEEVNEIKEKIISQIGSTFPQEQILSARQQIESMSSEQLESFLKRNKMVTTESGTDSSNNECVFCSIISGKINSVKIDENEEAIAVLEINPVSRGHVIVIQKTHDEKLSKKAYSLAENISKKLKKKLFPREVEISNSKLFGHEIINVIPVYENQNIRSKRGSAKIEELEKIKEELEKEKKIEKIKKPKKEKIKHFFFLPKRIP